MINGELVGIQILNQKVFLKIFLNTMKDPIELIMVTGDNNNKFYRMVDLDDGNFKVEYGRVGVTSINESYPISRWYSKYREKIKKG